MDNASEVIFLLILQRSWEESSMCSNECPHNFEMMLVEGDNDLRSSNDHLLCADRKCMVELVENELYLSIKMNFAEYVETLVEEVARQVVCSSKADLAEVI